MLNEKVESRKALIRAALEKQSNCVRDPIQKWEFLRLPSQERAAELCAGCPLLGKECRRYLVSGEPTWGVYDGVAIDKHGLEDEDD